MYHTKIKSLFTRLRVWVWLCVCVGFACCLLPGIPRCCTCIASLAISLVADLLLYSYMRRMGLGNVRIRFMPYASGAAVTWRNICQDVAEAPNLISVTEFLAFGQVQPSFGFTGTSPSSSQRHNVNEQDTNIKFHRQSAFIVAAFVCLLLLLSFFCCDTGGDYNSWRVLCNCYT